MWGRGVGSKRDDVELCINGSVAREQLGDSAGVGTVYGVFLCGYTKRPPGG